MGKSLRQEDMYILADGETHQNCDLAYLGIDSDGAETRPGYLMDVAK